MRTMTDLEQFVSRPNSGTAETAVSPGWRTLAALAPETKIVIIRRPAHEVVESLMALPVDFNRAAIKRIIAGADRKLDQIAMRLPVMSIPYADLEQEETCAEIFEYCLPYQHDHAHWRWLSRVNVQVDPVAFFSHSADMVDNFSALSAIAKAEPFRRVTTCLQ